MRRVYPRTIVWFKKVGKIAHALEAPSKDHGLQDSSPGKAIAPIVKLKQIRKASGTIEF